VTTLSITMTILSAGVVVLVMRGTLGRLDVYQVRTAVAEALFSHRPYELRLDVAAVAEVDLELAAALAEVARQAAVSGTTITIGNASAHVRRQIALGGGGHLLVDG
jgi:ABC-type transporter Mla MlaB component